MVFFVVVLSLVAIVGLVRLSGAAPSEAPSGETDVQRARPITVLTVR